MSAFSELNVKSGFPQVSNFKGETGKRQKWLFPPLQFEKKNWEKELNILSIQANEKMNSSCHSTPPNLQFNWCLTTKPDLTPLSRPSPLFERRIEPKTKCEWNQSKWLLHNPRDTYQFISVQFILYRYKMALIIDEAVSDDFQIRF